MLIKNKNEMEEKIQADINYIYKNNDFMIYVDGWMDENILNLDDKIDHIPPGVFNWVKIIPKQKEIRIINDPLGQRQLFFSMDNNGFVISSNFWEVINHIRNCELNWDAIEDNIVGIRISKPYDTYVKNVYVLPAGVMATINWGSNSKFKLEHHSKFQQRPNNKLKIEDAIDETVNSLDTTMMMVKKTWPGRKVVFGNSGGLDSRLIPLFAQRNDVEVEGYLIGDKRPKKILLSRSAKSADILAKKFNINSRFLDYNMGDFLIRMERDVIVNPLGPANFFKNPLFWEYEHCLVVNAANSFIITNDRNTWKKFILQNNIGVKLLNQYMLRKPLKGNQDYDNSTYIQNIADYFDKYINIDDTFSRIRSMHQIFWNKLSPNGGFESLNLAGDFLFLYYPYLWKKTLEWPEAWFFDRKIQYGVFNRVGEDLAKIPPQRPKKIGDISKIKYFLTKIDSRLRGSGIDYRWWESTKWFRDADKMLNEKIDSDFLILVEKHGLTLNRNFLDYQDYYDLLKINWIINKIKKYNKNRISY